MCAAAKEETSPQPCVLLSGGRESVTPRAVFGVGILKPREEAWLRIKVRGHPGHQVERGQRAVAGQGQGSQVLVMWPVMPSGNGVWQVSGNAGPRSGERAKSPGHLFPKR